MGATVPVLLPMPVKGAAGAAPLPVVLVAPDDPPLLTLLRLTCENPADDAFFVCPDAVLPRLFRRSDEEERRVPVPVVVVVVLDVGALVL